MILANAFLAVAAFLAQAAGVSTVPASRSFEATYVATVEEIPAGLNRLEIWIPLPQDTPAQRIRNLRVDSPYPGAVRRENEFGNSYYYFSTDQPRSGKLEIRVSFEAQRQEVLSAGLLRAGQHGSQATLERYLKEENLVTLSPRVRELAHRITYGNTTAQAKARAIYDYIVNTMIYDKTPGTGWGNGDTERACDVAKGNCTDFHSLFMSLARAEGIPARFIIGFPLKPEPEGTVPGYHCWAEFYLPDRGWIPVDASDASKATDPGKRNYLFGNLDPDRIQFTMGRDIRLDPPPCAETLNYFIYPYAQGDGHAITPVSIRLEYRNLPKGSSGAVSSAY